jgi:hypothetical protein
MTDAEVRENLPQEFQSLWDATLGSAKDWNEEQTLGEVQDALHQLAQARALLISWRLDWQKATDEFPFEGDFLGDKTDCYFKENL